MRTSDPSAPAAGTVVVVPFPYSDRLAEKRRPAVVISGPAVAEAGFVWIAMITSARHEIRGGDLPIPDLEAAGLDVASMVRPSKIACIEPSRILRRIGALSVPAAEAVFEAVRSRIGPA
ncbi:type II toxin-antitoxin system PemK/MazF family toxin [Methylobacterium gossipiicola]|uniref:mRNA interferase MazF n=1 Tax=Methylobacterium gossipiicola TaxID=582675 RepID=A0A1I2VWP4_9HYPH|nr:type II toxin-antitoxin system PemK/MazF family toxin [Methylobacterium gossipiicola]SFG92136.1 mRNA interferase MazF [Methylobacterium gossipiicola]